MKPNVSRVYEDFFDDNAGQLQTSLKGLSNELDSPMDYDYQMIIRDDKADIRKPEWFEKTKDKIDSIVQSTFIEFSSVYRRGEIEDVDELAKDLFIFGFNNTMRSPKVFRRFMSQLFKILDTVDFCMYTKDDSPVMILRYFDDMYVYELINAAYILFPYDKFGFQPFDCFMDIEPESRLADIANVMKVDYTGQYDGVVDLSELVNDPNAKYKYSFNYLVTSLKFRLPIGVCDAVDKEMFDNVVFKAKDLRFKDPYYQFGSNTNSGKLFYSLDIMLGPCYIKPVNIVVDLVISCKLGSTVEEHDFINNLPEFLHNVDELFGGKMPDVLRKYIIYDVKDVGNWDDEDDEDDVLQ